MSMIAASWAVSTVISIPPLFGLKDPLVEEDHAHNFSGHFHFRRRPGPMPDTAGSSVNPLLIGEGGKDHASRTHQADSTIPEPGTDTANSGEWVNGTVTLDDKRCCRQNLDYNSFD